MKFYNLDNQILLKTNHDVLIGELKFEKTKTEINITDVYVYPGFRDNKFGKKMIEYVVKNNEEYKVKSEKWFAKDILGT